MGLRIDGVHFAGFNERSEDCPVLATAVGAREQRVLAIEGNLPVILPISGRRSRHTISRSLSMGDVWRTTSARSAAPGALSISRRHPARLRWSQHGCWVPWFAPVW